MTDLPRADANLTPANNWKLKLSLLYNFFVLALLLNSVGAVALQAQRAYGVSASAASLLAVGKSGGIFAASLFAVFYLARIGYRRAMLVALGGLAAVCVLVPSAPDFAMMKVLFVTAGASFAVIKAAIYASVGLITTDRKSHASFMSFLEAGFTFGVLSGSFLFGVFTDDAHPQSTEWLRVFHVLAGLSAIGLALLLWAPLDESRLRAHLQRPAQQHDMMNGRRTLGALVLTFGACVFLYVMIEQSTMNWLPTFNRLVLRLPVSLSIQMAGLLMAAMAVGRLLAGFVLRRVSWFSVLAVCLLASAALVSFTLSLAGELPDSAVTGWSTAPAAAFVFPLLGFFIAPIYPAINSIVLSSLPISQHGFLASLGVGFSALGSSLGTLMLGYLFDAHGGRMAFYCLLLPIVGLLGCLYLFARQSEAAVAGPADPL